MTTVHAVSCPVIRVCTYFAEWKTTTATGNKASDTAGGRTPPKGPSVTLVIIGTRTPPNQLLFGLLTVLPPAFPVEFRSDR